MKVLFWNIRGIGNDVSQNMLRLHCQSVRPDWLCLAEPKVPFSSILPSFWRSLNLQFVSSNSRSSGTPNLWVFCSHRVASFSTVFSSDQVVIIQAEFSSRSFYLAFVHGHALHSRRRQLWEDIRMRHLDPVMVIGDFKMQFWAPTHSRRREGKGGTEATIP